MFFDARAAKLLQPGAHLVIDGCPGLRLVATSTRKTWTYRYKAAATDRMKQVAIGHWPAMPVQAAAAAWQALRDQRAAGVDPGQARRDRRAEISGTVGRADAYTVRQVVQDLIDGPLKQRKAAGAAAAQRALERLLEEEPDLAAQPAAAVTRSQAFDALNRRTTTPTSTAKLRSMLGSAWDLALDAGRIADTTPNWWRLILKGKLKSRGKLVGGEHVGVRRRVLPAPEIATLLAWLPNMHELGRDTTQMYLWTCARGAEILAMRAEHLVQEKTGWWWTVPAALTKNARHEHAIDHRVPLFGRALAIVERRLKAVEDGVSVSGWLFEDARHEQYTQHDFSTYIYSLQPHSEKVARRLGEGLVLPVANWTPHDLRRTGRTLLASLGCPQEVAEAILGHMPKGVVGVYNAYTYDAERLIWLKKLSDYLGGLATPAALPARP